jgi:ABC-type amino acid transport substrate-binding protein
MGLAQSIRGLPATIAIVLALLVSAYADAAQQVAEDKGFPDRELMVGTKIAPPFAMKAPDGSWSGISIDLWKEIADHLGLKYHFVEEPTVQSLIAATAHGNFGLSVAAITITAEREQVVDFSQPFYDIGLGIAVSTGDASVRRVGRGREYEP